MTFFRIDNESYLYARRCPVRRRMVGIILISRTCSHVIPKFSLANGTRDSSHYWIPLYVLRNSSGYDCAVIVHRVSYTSHLAIIIQFKPQYRTSSRYRFCYLKRNDPLRCQYLKHTCKYNKHIYTSFNRPRSHPSHALNLPPLQFRIYIYIIYIHDG